MGIHFEADAVRHKEMKDYFTVMIPLTYQKGLLYHKTGII